MSVIKALDRLHYRASKSLFLQRFTIFTRIILAVGFIPPSLVKIMDHRFTTIPTKYPIGYFFDALFKTGFYYQFIGITQLSAAILLLIPMTAFLGELIYFPIILNIFIITVSLHFKGTWLVTGLMLLACTYLLCWDYPKWRGAFTKRSLVTSE